MTFGYWARADRRVVNETHAATKVIEEYVPICSTIVSGLFQWCGQGDAIMMLRYVTCKRCKRLLEPK